MRVTEMQALQLFRRATQFLERETPTVAIGDLGPQVGQLKQVADRVAAQAATQDTSKRLGKATADARDVEARDMRDEYMRPIAHLGSALFPSDSELLRALTMPRGSVRARQRGASPRGM